MKAHKDSPKKRILLEEIILSKNNDYSSLQTQLDSGYTPAQGVSIILPVYNNVNRLRKTLTALSLQHYPEHLTELVVTDDGSGPEVKKLIEEMEFPFDVKYVWQEDNGFQAGTARNNALRIASNEYVIFIDDDMIASRDFVRNHMMWHHMLHPLVVMGHREYVKEDAIDLDMIVNHPEAMFDENQVKLHQFNRSRSGRDPRLRIYDRTNFLRDNSKFRFVPGERLDNPPQCANTNNVSLPKQLAFDVGLFDEEFNGWGGEDTHFMARVYPHVKFFIPDTVLDGTAKGLRATAFHLNHKSNPGDPQKLRELKKRKMKYVNLPVHTPTVSVYMPTYGKARFVKAAVDSVLTSTFSDLEVCLCIDGLYDKSVQTQREKREQPGQINLILEMLETEYGNNQRIRWTSQTNKGIGSASNTAFRMCRGKYVAQVDPDDEIEPNAIMELVNYMDQHRELVSVGSNHSFIDENGKLKIRKNRYNFRNGEVLRKGEPRTGDPHHVLRRDFTAEEYNQYMFEKGLAWRHLRMTRRDIFYATAGFTETLANAIDYDFALKLMEAAHKNGLGMDWRRNIDGTYNQTSLYRYRIHENNTTKLRRDGERLQTTNARKAKEDSKVRRSGVPTKRFYTIKGGKIVEKRRLVCHQKTGIVEPTYPHELDKYSSGVSTEFFKKQSELPPHLKDKHDVLSERKTLSFMGLDLKMNPDGKVSVIEIGGANVNSEGMRKADPDTNIEDKMYEVLSSFGLPAWMVTTNPPKMRARLTELLGSNAIRIKPEYVKDGSYKERLARVVQGEDVTAKDSTVKYQPNYVVDPAQASAVILNKTENAIRFNEGKHIIANPRKFEAIMYDKRRVELLLQGLGVRPKALILDENVGLEEYATFMESCGDYLVLKDARGTCGKGILVAKRSDILRPDGSLVMNPRGLKTEDGKQPLKGIEDLLIEEYVESVPYKESGKEYDKCMRYLIAVDTMGDEIKLHHLGGYWRVGLSPLGEDPQTSMKINLSTGANCMKASKNDLCVVREALDKVFPTFYQRLMTFPLADGNTVYLKK